MKTTLGDLIADANWEVILSELTAKGFAAAAAEIAKLNEEWEEITSRAQKEARYYSEEEYAEVLAIESRRLETAMKILRGFINPEI